MRNASAIVAGAVCLGVLGGVLGAAPEAGGAVVEYELIGRVTGSTGSGFYGFVPPLFTQVTMHVKLDNTLTYIGPGGTQTNAFPGITAGFTAQIGAQFFSASSYGVYVQNQNFANNAQLAVQAAGGFLWNGNPVPVQGGPTLQLNSFTAPNIALMSFTMLDLTTPWLLSQTTGSLSQFSAMPAPGTIDFEFLSVQLVPAPGAAGLAAVGLGVAGRRRRR